jgi:hypothetical protein
MSAGWRAEEGAIPFVVVGVLAIGGVLGLAWAGQQWAQTLLHEAGGELTVFVLRGAFWSLDLVALQASTAPVTRDWYTPVLEGVALPIYVLAALVMVATLIAEVVAGMVTGNTPRIVQAIFRALVAGMLASAAASLLLAAGGALSNLGQIALAAAGTTVDAPLVPLQEVLMDSALQRETGAELFVVFLAGFVIVFASLAIYFTLAMRPVLLAALIVFLPVAHALSVWTPMRRVQVRAWSLAFAVLLADAAILTMFAVTNTVMSQPSGVDRLIFGTFGVLLSALAPAALARIVGTPELQTAVQAMSRGSKAAAVGAGVVAVKGALVAQRAEQGIRRAGSQPAGGAIPTPGGRPSGGPGGPGGPAAGSAGSPPAAGGGPSSTGGGGASARPSGGPSSSSAASGSTGRPSATTVGGTDPAPATASASSSSDASRTAASSGPPSAPSAGGWQGALTRPAAGARP